MAMTFRPMRKKLASPHRNTESTWQPGRRAAAPISSGDMAAVIVATASGYRRKASMHDTVTYGVTGMSWDE